MSKRVSRDRRETHAAGRADKPTRTAAVVPSADPALDDTGTVHNRLARLFDTPLLTRVAPHLAPETLHQLIRSRGLDACGELVTAMTPDQLTSVFDLDLWRNRQPGRDERFDEDRFGEWLELLVDTGDAGASALAAIDEDLVIAGLSRYIRVLDPATFEPTAQSDDEVLDEDVHAPFDGVECEVGGYLVRARRTATWDAVVTLLHVLAADHGDYFHAVMQGCRRLSNSTPEIDGLDELLLEPEQQLHDVALERESRRTQVGYATPADARAFLELARRPRHHRPDAGRASNPIAAAYFRAADEAASSAADRSVRPQERALAPPTPADVPESLAAVVDLLAAAGLMPERPRALLEGADSQPPRCAQMRRLMACLGDTDDTAYLKRSRELAFLANTLMAGCSVQGRSFTTQEASDGAVAICNLGLEHWPARWPNAGTLDRASAEPAATLPETFLAHHDLVTAFEAGWAVLHEDVSLFVAEHLIATLRDLRCVDAEIQEGLHTLRRELVRLRDAGRPWRARAALDVLSMLDMTVWAGVLGLLDECPVMPAAVPAILEGSTRSVSATAFEFISTASQIRDVRAFMRKLLDVLLA